MLPANCPVASSQMRVPRWRQMLWNARTSPAALRVTTMLWPFSSRTKYWPGSLRLLRPPGIEPHRPEQAVELRLQERGVGVVARRQRARAFGHHVARLDGDFVPCGIHDTTLRGEPTSPRAGTLGPDGDRHQPGHRRRGLRHAGRARRARRRLEPDPDRRRRVRVDADRARPSPKSAAASTRPAAPTSTRRAAFGRFAGLRSRLDAVVHARRELGVGDQRPGRVARLLLARGHHRRRRGRCC